MPKSAWRRRKDGAFVAEQDGLNLTVFQPASHAPCRAMAQFAVTGWHNAVPNAIIGSGLAEGITQAKRLAETMAARFTHEGPAGQPQVMVVDDDTTVRDSLAAVLREDGSICGGCFDWLPGGGIALSDPDNRS